MRITLVIIRTYKIKNPELCVGVAPSFLDPYPRGSSPLFYTKLMVELRRNLYIGRSSDLRLIYFLLLPAPDIRGSGLAQVSLPITAAGPRLIRTAFPLPI